MSTSRRDFLLIAAATTAGLGMGMSGWASSGGGAIKEMPSEKELKAKRWGLVIDTKKFNTDEDFQRCIDACNSIHNVPTKIETNQNVKWIWQDEFARVFPRLHNPHLAKEVEERKYLMLCNHCLNPPCVRVCPTKATFKSEDGITMMDFHRCIGCRYCMAACPYGARSFNFMDPRPYIPEGKQNAKFPTRTKGVVEKCNLCAERLAVGEKPACVEASKGGILFGDLDDPNSEVSKALQEHFALQRKPELGTNPSLFYMI